MSWRPPGDEVWGAVRLQGRCSNRAEVECYGVYCQLLSGLEPPTSSSRAMPPANTRPAVGPFEISDIYSAGGAARLAQVLVAGL